MYLKRVDFYEGSLRIFNNHLYINDKFDVSKNKYYNAPTILNI